MWSWSERLENLRSQLLLGLEPPFLLAFFTSSSHACRLESETRRERLENSAALTAVVGQEAPVMVAGLKR